jgi:hypothetical protein
MRVTIVSGFTGQAWSDERPDDDRPDEDILEGRDGGLWREFNRVVDEDGPRLERLGFRQPSLSVGDLVILHDDERGGRAYRVAGVGFTPIPFGPFALA